MFVSSISRRSRASIREIAAADFKSGKPFSFLCNKHDFHNPMTPNSLFEDHGITDFGNMRHVSVYLTSENLEAVLEAIEAWNEAAYRVSIKFPILTRRPAVGDQRNHLFCGLDVEACYCLTDRLWMASAKLKSAVKDLFAGDDLVTVHA